MIGEKNIVMINNLLTDLLRRTSNKERYDMMNGDKTAETINNLLADFLRGFEKDVWRIYKPYKYKKDDVLPVWRATFCRQNKAVAFRDACVGYFSRFLETSLPLVKEFCPSVNEFFYTKHEEVKKLLSKQLDSVVIRRSSYDPAIVRSGITLCNPFVTLPICPRCIKGTSFNNAIVKATLISMRKFVSLMRNVDDCLQTGR